jgi:hypothetical protein
VETLSNLAKNGNVSAVLDEPAVVRIEFPAADPSHWKAIENGVSDLRHIEIGDVINLVSFLVGKDATDLQQAGHWGKVVRGIQDQLDRGNGFNLPIRLQILRA